MNVSPSVAASYRHVRRLSRRSGSNFYRSFWLLPRPKRDAMYSVYAFARVTDDLGDCDRPAVQRGQWLDWWRRAAELNLGESSSMAEIVLPAGLDDASDSPIDLRRQAQAILPSLRDSIARYEIPSRYFFEIIDGVLADQQKTRFETYEQLEHYCYLVVSAIGLACLHIWGFKEPLPIRQAIDCGLAFQLTNIIRDITEDAQRGRIYLPRQHYEQHGLCEDDLLNPRGDDRLCCLIVDEIERAKHLYASGWDVWESMHDDGRPMFSMMWRTYRQLLDRIAADPAAVTRRRVQLSSREQWSLLSQHYFSPLFRRLPVPPLEVSS